MRWVVGLLLALSVGLAFPALADGDDDDFRVSGGKHTKHLDDGPIEYEIVYTHAYGTLTIDSTGCTYYFPRWNWYWRPPCDYDDDYFGAYMVYFINSWVNYEVHLKNTGKRALRNLEVSATQEYHEDICWGGSCAEKGDAMPGDPTRTWTVAELKPGEEVVLQGAHFAAGGTLPGLDQTHLVVTADKNGKALGHDRDGDGDDDHLHQNGLGHHRRRVLIDDPEAGVYCPPEPVVAAGP